MNAYARELYQFVAPHANTSEAVKMAAYMKNHFAFWGIKAPKRKELSKQFFQRYALPKPNEWKDVVWEIWQLPEREMHYIAMELAEKMKKHWTKEDITFFERMVVTNSWWDTVDFIATHLCGKFLMKFPELIPTQTASWAKHQNLWLNRVSIIFQLAYKDKTDEALLFEHCLLHAASKEFFIQKAIGWALREHAKRDPQSVIAFVNKHTLKPLSVREALKHLK